MCMKPSRLSSQGWNNINHVNNASSRDEKCPTLIFLQVFKTNTCLLNFLSLTKHPNRTTQKIFLQNLWVHFKNMHMSSHSSSKPTKLLKMILLTVKKCIQDFCNTYDKLLASYVLGGCFLYKKVICVRKNLFSVSKKFMEKINKL